MTKMVREGKYYTMVPSMGYEGIERGIVKVIEAIDYQDVPKEKSSDLVTQAKEDDDINALYALVMESWVCYKYKNENDLCYMPHHIFSDHASIN